VLHDVKKKCRIWIEAYIVIGIVWVCTLQRLNIPL
jgi:hypothetical protein